MEIQDFGEKIGGAKKDLWRTRGMSISDLCELNDLEIKDMVNKENVWGKVDWASLKGTKPNEVLYVIKFIRDRTPSKPSFYARGSWKVEDLREKNRTVAEKYIEAVTNIKEYCNKYMNKLEDFKGFLKKFGVMYGYMDEERFRYKDKCRDATIFSSSKWVRGVQFSSTELEELASECRIQGFPDRFRGDLKGVCVKRYSGKYTLVNNRRLLKSGLYFDTEEEAYKYAETTLIEELDRVKEESAVAKKGSLKITRPQLEHVSRTGPDLRKGQDSNTDIMLDVFKFRGGEFGNWNSDKDRQQCLNYAFDAFVDLAYLLDMPLRIVGL